MKDARWFFLLKFCASITLIARGWLLWQWDNPFRKLGWLDQTGLTILGVSLIVLGVAPWLVSRFKKAGRLLLPATALLIFDSVARWVATGYQVGMGIEHSLQMLAPLALFIAISAGIHSSALRNLLLVATAFTFVGHGLYAAGIHSVPGIYLKMTTNILGVSAESALLFLKIAGWLDFIAAACLFITPLRKFALIYMIFWGAATALARVVAFQTMDPWLVETAVRTSHWMIPLFLILTSVPARKRHLATP